MKDSLQDVTVTPFTPCQHGEPSSACCITCIEERPPPHFLVKTKKLSTTSSPRAYLKEACASFSTARAHKTAFELVELLRTEGEINAQQDGLLSRLLEADIPGLRGLTEATRLEYLRIAIRYLELSGLVRVTRQDSVTGAQEGNRLEGLCLL